ncbi:MAG: threonine-phosphate decarboxylase [Alphaproteobacteria bacterium]|nr:threonine-phosphate decarboxylase [Alphaproteobacteria bacterium]MDE2012705.1 threonine-phosphate decarboxylase [Alphaproteobacteria bacterium]MDE2072029.1 threonine-phosphate decarboxylase [Alphaproteobacteria bacterium]MDE2350855.1 threonine-phosphate decarboxylase [Alphaproteobacteria bacterium]
MLEHGGNLRTASERHRIPLAQWLDLSTGINPDGWPVPDLPADLWNRLPEDHDGLEAAAEAYYGAHLLPVAGSQAAIQALPFLRAPCRVGVIAPGYAEHAHAWQERGHAVTPLSLDDMHSAATACDVLVLINPNNPTGNHFLVEQMLQWHAQLAARGGWLIVDEAFMDATPEQSLLPFMPRPGLVVLRSLGKFFGLAGLRVGFVCAEPDMLARLQDHLGPWPIAAASRWVGAAALRDRHWQANMRRQLHERTGRLVELLRGCGLAPAGGTALFQWVCTKQAPDIHAQLAARGILTRLFETPASLRFGLPASETDWQKLEAALREAAR